MLMMMMTNDKGRVTDTKMVMNMTTTTTTIMMVASMTAPPSLTSFGWRIQPFENNQPKR